MSGNSQHYSIQATAEASTIADPGSSSADVPARLALHGEESHIQGVLKRLAFKKRFMRCSCVIVVVAICLFAGVPGTLIVLPQLNQMRLSLKRGHSAQAYSELPEGMNGENFYVRQGNTLLGVWHLYPNSTEGTREQIIANKKLPILMYFQGDSFDRTRSSCIELYGMLVTKMQIVTFDYRGFADSAGYANSRSMMEDGLTVFDMVIDRYRKNNKVFFWGHSRGSSVATELMYHLQERGDTMSGLILESPIYSITETLKYRLEYQLFFGWLPNLIYQWAIVDPFHSYGMVFSTSSYASNITSPILVLFAEDDTKVNNPDLMKKLYHEIQANESSVVFHVEFQSCFNYGHTDIYRAAELDTFLTGFLKAVERLDKERLNERANMRLTTRNNKELSKRTSTQSRGLIKTTSPQNKRLAKSTNVETISKTPFALTTIMQKMKTGSPK